MSESNKCCDPDCDQCENAIKLLEHKWEFDPLSPIEVEEKPERRLKAVELQIGENVKPRFIEIEEGAVDASISKVVEATESIVILYANHSGRESDNRGQFRKDVEAVLTSLISQALTSERERMVAIGNSLRDEIRSRYRGGDGDMSDDFYDGEEAAIATYQQKIKSLDS